MSGGGSRSAATYSSGVYTSMATGVGTGAGGSGVGWTMAVGSGKAAKASSEGELSRSRLNIIDSSKIMSLDILG